MATLPNWVLQLGAIGGITFLCFVCIGAYIGIRFALALFEILEGTSNLPEVQ